MSLRTVLLSWITWSLLSASAEARPPDADFFDSASLQEVELEVFVTDRQSQPVLDLTAADFEVFDEGKAVDLTHFARVARTAGDGAELGSHHIVLFFDLPSIPSGRLGKTLDTLRASPWLRKRSNDRVMVVSHVGDGALEIVQSPTTSPTALGRALDRIAAEPAASNSLAPGYFELVKSILTLDGRGTPETTPEEEMQQVVEDFERQLEVEREELGASLLGLQDLVDSLAGLSGPKAIVYVTGGLLESPGKILTEAFRDRLRGSAKGLDLEKLAQDFSFLENWRELTERTKANRVAFYPLLTGGGRERPLSASATEPDQRTSRNLLWHQRVAALLDATLEGQVGNLSEATGGFSLEIPKGGDTNPLDGLYLETHTHYRLRFQAPRRSDGSNHELSVQLQRRNLTTRHRQGYCDKTPDRSLHDLTVSALLFDLDNNELDIKVEAGQGVRQDGHILVPVTVRFPYDRLLLLPEDTYHQGQVTIYVGTRDAAGRTAPMKRVPAQPIRIANDKLLSTMAGEAIFRLDLPLPAGEHSLVVGVRDELAAVESTTRVDLDPAL